MLEPIHNPSQLKSFKICDKKTRQLIDTTKLVEDTVETMLNNAGVAESKTKYSSFSQGVQHLSHMGIIGNGNHSFAASTSTGAGISVGDGTVSMMQKTLLGIGQTLSTRHVTDLVCYEDYSPTLKTFFRKWKGFAGSMEQRNLDQGFNTIAPIGRDLKEWTPGFWGNKIQLGEHMMLQWASSNSMDARGIMEALTVNSLYLHNIAHRARKENIVNALVYGKNIYNGQLIPYGINPANKIVPIGYPIKSDGTQDASVNPFQVIMNALYGFSTTNTLPVLAQTRKTYVFINKRTYTDVFATHPAVTNVIRLAFNNPAAFKSVDGYKIDEGYKDIFVKLVEIGGTELILVVDDQFRLENGSDNAVDLTTGTPYIPDYVALIVPDVSDLGSSALTFQYTLNSSAGGQGTTGISVNAFDMTAFQPDNPHILLLGQMNGATNVIYEESIFKMDFKENATPAYPSL